MDLKTRGYLLEELMSTEEAYVQDLSLVVDGYMKEIDDENSNIPTPDDLSTAKHRMVYGNIEAIYEWHRDYFLESLKSCIQDPVQLAKVIKDRSRKLGMYVVYSQNKPLSEHILSEHSAYFNEIRLKLKQKLTLPDLLIKPVQRITKYELLFKNIYIHTERAGLTNELPILHDALAVIKNVIKEANDMMDVSRLQRFDGKITGQGKLLLHGPMLCIEGATNVDRNSSNVMKPRDLQVFLFEQSIIFSEIIGKKTQFTNPSYIYKNHIQSNKMKMEPMPDNRFCLRSTDPQRLDISYVIIAQTSEQYHEWMDQIKNILDVHHSFLIAIQRPIEYQNARTRES